MDIDVLALLENSVITPNDAREMLGMPRIREPDDYMLRLDKKEHRTQKLGEPLRCSCCGAIMKILSTKCEYCGVEYEVKR